MRSLLVIVILFGGCTYDPFTNTTDSSATTNDPVYSPHTFRRDISKLISEERYDDAIRFGRPGTTRLVIALSAKT
jgi:hypothetical protein